MTIDINPIAVYAAFVSTCSLIWLIWKEMPKIRIDILTLEKKDDKYSLHVCVINKTGHPIKLETYGVYYMGAPKYKQSISILVSEGDEERIIKERDNLYLSIDVGLLKKSDKKVKLKSFFILDSTYHSYNKKIPASIAYDFTK